MNISHTRLPFASHRRVSLVRSARPALSLLLLALALLSSGAIALAQDSVDVSLNPVDNSGVTGTVHLVAAGTGTEATLDITGLDPNAQATATLHAGTCDLPGASFAPLPALTADAGGRATATGSILFHGTEDVALADIADDEHVIVVQAGSRVVACGVIPRLGAANAASAPAAAPAELPTTGGLGLPLAPALTVLLGLGAVAAGLRLRARRAA